MLKRFAILAVLSVAAISAVVSAQQQVTRPVEGPWLVSSDLLNAGNMEMAWQRNLPLDVDEDIDRMFVFDNYAYVLTSKNYLFCIDSRTGQLRFPLKLATAGLPVCDPIYVDNKLFFIVGNELHIVNPASGAVTDSYKLPAIGRSASCAIDKNEDFFYIAGSNNRLTAISTESYIRQFQVTSDDDMPILTLACTENYLVFATSTGSVICTEPDSPDKVWQFDGAEGLKAPIRQEDWYIYVSSLDTNIYKLDVRTGQSQWVTPFGAGSPLEKPVRLGDDLLYQYGQYDGMYAITKETGSEVWNLPTGIEILTEKGGRAYVFALPGVLTVMDNIKAEKLYSVNFAQITDFAVNTRGLIYVGNDDGRVMAIRPLSD